MSKMDLWALFGTGNIVYNSYITDQQKLNVQRVANKKSPATNSIALNVYLGDS